MRGLGLDLGVLDGLREEGTGNLLGDKGRGITSFEEGLGEVSGVGVEVIWVTVDAPPRLVGLTWTEVWSWP